MGVRCNRLTTGLGSLVKKDVGRSNTRPAWADALEDSMVSCAIVAAQFRVAPGIIHHNYSAGVDKVLGVIKADWAHQHSFFRPIYYDHIEFLWRNGMEIRRVFESRRVLTVEFMVLQHHVVQTHFREPSPDVLKPGRIIFGADHRSNPPGKKESRSTAPILEYRHFRPEK